ncbi:hypothetical protein HDV62DRAFT_401981 [Trichoderma sp. SZMC 28011]
MDRRHVPQTRQDASYLSADMLPRKDGSIGWPSTRGNPDIMLVFETARGLRASGARKGRDKEAYSLRLRLLIHSGSPYAEEVHRILGGSSPTYQAMVNEPPEQFAARQVLHPASCWTNVVNLSTRGIPMGFDFNVSQELYQFVIASAWREE